MILQKSNVTAKAEAKALEGNYLPKTGGGILMQTEIGKCVVIGKEIMISKVKG